MTDSLIGKKKYILHTSVSDFSILLLSIIFNPKTYGAVDYRVLYENNISLMYLTKTGYKQAFRISRNLVNEKFFQNIIVDSKQLNKDLKLYTVPNLNKNNIIKEWKNYLKITNEFCRLYRFYEQPFQQKLEEVVLKYISEDELIKKLANSKKQHLDDINIDKRAKDALSKLIILGKMKLKLHYNAENLVTKDLMKFISFVADQTGLSKKIVSSFTVDEFTDALNGKLPKFSLLKKRLNGCAVVKRKNKWYFEAGNKYLYWKNRITSNQEKTISGNVAYPGKVRGKVVLHQSWTDTMKINKGEILVTGMTNPQMVPYIKSASAIITDEGGITCHAAIISREMKKPCITGTKNATQLLSNGDIVEIDANQGIVRILKKKKK